MVTQSNPFGSALGSLFSGRGAQNAAAVLGAGLLGLGGRPDVAMANVQGIQQQRQAQDMQAVYAQFQDRAARIGIGPAFKELLQTNPTAALDPQLQAAVKQVWEMEQQPKRETKVVGDQLLEIPAQGAPTVLHTAPAKAAEAPTSIREAQAMGFDLATASGRDAYAAYKRSFSHAPGGTTVINQIGQPTEQNPFAGIGMKRLEEVDAQAAKAASILPELDAMEQAIHAGAHQPGFGPNVGINTPWGTVGVDIEAATVPFLQVMAKLGLVDEGRLSETELFSTINSRLGPLLRPAGSGSSSDADVQLFLNALPGLSKSREGNLKIIDFYRRIHERNLQEMEIMEQMLLEKRYSPSAFRRATAQLGDLFDAEAEASLDRAMVPPPAPQAAPAPAPAINLGTGAGLPGAGPTPAEIGQMQREQIMMLNPSELNAEQRAAMINRLSALGM